MLTRTGVEVRRCDWGRGCKNHLNYGDNLKVLRESIRDASVDLIYLDPPFNSNASYNVLFKGPAGADSAAQIEAFDDTWHWNDSAEEAFGDVMRGGNAAASTMLRVQQSGNHIKLASSGAPNRREALPFWDKSLC